MSKQTWNAFIKKHANPHGFSAAVCAALPNGPHFDKSRKKLPTPYGLFLEWASVTLKGEWASAKVPGGFIICVAETADAASIKKRFGTLGVPKRTPACANTQQINYKDSSYGGLAKSIG